MLLLLFFLSLSLISSRAAPLYPSVAIVTSSGTNDLRSIFPPSSFPVYSSFDDAVNQQAKGSAILVLADGYPAVGTSINPSSLQKAALLQMAVYLEFPSSIPGANVSLPFLGSYSSRLVITDDMVYMPVGAILVLQGITLVNVNISSDQQAEMDTLMGFTLVAGYGHAAFGLPPAAQIAPVLFTYSYPGLPTSFLVATTKLSSLITSRAQPQTSFRLLWDFIFSFLSPSSFIQSPAWTPTVYPSYSQTAALPSNAEEIALSRAVSWLSSSLTALVLTKHITPNISYYCPLQDPTPVPSSLTCVLEGYTSQIAWNGSQSHTENVRMDCNAESAMVLAMGGHESTASDIIDYVYLRSPGQQGQRSNVSSALFGLIAWGVSSPAWEASLYSDDMARVLLSSLVTAAVLNSSRWDIDILEGLMGNLRITGINGISPGAFGTVALETAGWRPYFSADFTLSNVAWSTPHYQSYIWACFLWAYARTGFDLFYQRAYAGISMTMGAYGNWSWTEYLSEESARMLLPLAWLVRVSPSNLTRSWLSMVANDYLALQQPSGAVREQLGLPGRCLLCPPSSNAAYGESEAPLIQEDGDSCSDLLYSHNFAFIGLHEAAAATGDPYYSQAENRLAEFLVRAQAKSTKFPDLDGAWFRGFDFEMWDYWGSTADPGWGPWSVETGWTESWISATLALRQRGTSLWDLIRSSSPLISPTLCTELCPFFFPRTTICSSNLTLHAREDVQ